MDRLEPIERGRATGFGAAVAVLLAAIAAPAIAAGGPGTIDATFGTNGVVQGARPATVAADGLLRQSTGKLVIVGTIGSGPLGTAAPYAFDLVRLTEGGVIDSTFGADGETSTFFGGGGHAFAMAAAVQSDDKILVGGNDDSGAKVARYTADGSVDATFGASGIADLSSVGYFIESLTVQADGRILFAGGWSDNGTSRWLLGRLTSSGSPDPTFGTNGFVKLTWPVTDRPAMLLPIVVEPDGHLYAANGTVLGHFSADGAPDPGFGTSGFVTVDFGLADVYSQPLALVLGPGGSVVVGGTRHVDPGTIRGMALARYSATGQLDPTFGTSGISTISMPTSSDSILWDLAIDAYGDLIAVGQSGNDLATVRVDSNGGLDPNFGTAGVARVPYGGPTYPAAVVIQPDARIVVATSYNTYLVDPQQPWLVARLEGNPPTVPAAATGVTATAGSGQAGVTWTPAASNGRPITGYTVISSPGAETCTTSGTIGCTVGGLTNGTAYTFTVTATNAIGTGPVSSPSIPVMPVTLPGAPTSVTGTSGNGQASVSWTAPASSGGSAITGYTVTSSPGAKTCTTSGTIGCIVGGLTNGASYTFTVTATNAVGTGPASSPSSPVTPATVPGAPTSVTATPGNAQASVSWTAPASNGGRPITGYTVTSSPSGKTCTTGGTIGCTVSGLTNGIAHTFRVTATNAVGTGDSSAASSSVTPATIPGTPTNVTAVASGSSIAVSWSAPVSSGGRVITDYTAITNPGTHTCTSGGALSCTISAVPDGVYTVTVTATSSVGSSAQSTASTSTRVDTTAPTVTGPAAIPAVGSTIGSAVATKLTWTGSDSGSGIGHYEVWLSTNAGSYVLVATPTSASYTRSLTASTTTTYRFRVRAVDAKGNVSGFAYGSNFHVRLVQQTSASYTGAWTTVSSTSASGGSYRYCTGAGAAISYSFTGRAIAVVGAVGTTFGSFKVYLDGVYVTTVSEDAGSTAWRRVLYGQRWSSGATHTIKLVNVGTTGHPRLDVDAFIVFG